MTVDFLDTNVFVYLFDETNARKRGISEEILRHSLANLSGAVSFQVVQETLSVITTKLKVKASTEDAQRFLYSVLSPLMRVMPSAELYSRALDIQSRYRFSFYDALIVAAALDARCSRLFSEDLQHGQRIGDLLIENPFLESAEA